ncbi:hypothetical protein E4T43_04889 [Aureobasidium subglaciale]|nr:hypothetical protein E4T43_04889 [Aureobasidium subglaciale]
MKFTLIVPAIFLGASSLATAAPVEAQDSNQSDISHDFLARLTMHKKCHFVFTHMRCEMKGWWTLDREEQFEDYENLESEGMEQSYKYYLLLFHSFNLFPLDTRHHIKMKSIFAILITFIGASVLVTAAPVESQDPVTADMSLNLVARLAMHKKCGTYRRAGCQWKASFSHGDITENYKACMRLHDCECAFIGEGECLYDG